MMLKEEIVLGIYSWLHMTPVGILVRNLINGGGSLAIIRLTVDDRGVQMGANAQGQFLCSFGFNAQTVLDIDDMDEGARMIKAEVMDGVIRLIPDYIELTEHQILSVREEVSMFSRICAMKILDGHGNIKSLWEKEILPRLQKHRQIQ